MRGPETAGGGGATAIPEVSVIIPTAGRLAFLQDALASALAQEDVALEVIVVVDADRDGARAWLDDLPDPRLRLAGTAGGQGPARARNLGLAEAAAPWVAFLDDDDLWSPRKLRGQLDAAARAGCSWAYTEAVDIDAAGTVVGVDRPPEPGRLRRELLRRNRVPAGASNVLVRTELARRLGGFDPELPTVADWDLSLRLSAAGPPALAHGLNVAYRRHADNHHTDDPSGFLEDLRRLEAKHSPLGVRPDRVSVTRWLAGGQRRAGHPWEALRLYLTGARSERNVGNALRALALLGGERVMATGRRLRDGHRSLPELEWLGHYR
jgi:glycosyltransferase involved in cell wall biosynthesis